MNQDFNTFELAGIYESQEYFQDALEMYQAMKKKDPSRGNELNEAIQRMELAIQNSAEEPDHALKQALIQTRDSKPEKKIEQLLEQWLMLMVLDKRLSAFNRVKKRL